MPQRYCEVALPVPLRSSFTYAVPPSANGEPLVGRRVVVPFRNRPMIGVAIEEAERAPEAANRARIKTITELMDSRVALTPALIELGRWISRYYLAPIGETFRAMLPPEIELRHDREYSLTDAGRAQLSQFALMDNVTAHAVAIAEAGPLALLRRFESNEAATSARVGRWPGGEAAVEKLVQQGLVAARDVARHRKARAQTIVAWQQDESPKTESYQDAPGSSGHQPHGNRDTPNSGEQSGSRLPHSESGPQPPKDSRRTEREREAEGRIREFLASSGPVPLPVLIDKAKVSRGAIDRLKKNGRLLAWKESITPDDDPWETNFAPPTNVLNAEQNQALAEIWRWIVAGKFAAGLLHGVTG
ncbi:MAG: hypothetical protein ACRD8A_19075, partial [Candidatus Acidiferrales bacterium]